MEEPEPGFPPAMIGAMGLFVVAAAGILKALAMKKNQYLDLSPQDLTVKALLYYIVKSVKKYETIRPAEVPVYNFSLYKYSKITMAEYIGICQDFNFWVDIATEKNFLAPHVTVTDSFMYQRFLVSIIFII